MTPAYLLINVPNRISKTQGCQPVEVPADQDRSLLIAAVERCLADAAGCD
ncbi:hypothetical protein RBSWK_02254 [Rhodopirellula baltica SWK14]|uniref:Uncharacterized protein n=1 Tax=Rhodopirellula baltica SWK14 TaxID=993516 RepID=L7CJD7_RHOBT|nr:hypothetical protein RBSWK_02254 [Rhodopirellula baltica SWK14]